MKSTHVPSFYKESQAHQEHQQPNQGFNVQMMYEPQQQTNDMDHIYQTQQEFSLPGSSDHNLNYLSQWSTPSNFLD